MTEVRRTYDAKEADVVVVMRVADLPIPNGFTASVVDYCGVCNAKVWLAARSPRGVPLICIPCCQERSIEELKAHVDRSKCPN